MRTKISVNRLLSKYENTIIGFNKIEFDINNKDVYNITSPFNFEGIEHIAGRVESRDSEKDSKVVFFTKENDLWIINKKAAVFDLQDPSISIINNEIIFGGIATKKEKGEINYKTVFYRGKSIYDLEKFAEGPLGMKDIRIGEVNSKIGIFTRPQGIIGGKGRIGFMKVNKIDNLPSLKEEYYSAKLIEDEFLKEEWLGVNAFYNLKNGKLGVIGHIAFIDKEGKHYYPIVFCFDQEKHIFSKMKIIARRKDIPKGNSKRPELNDILFPGGLIRMTNGNAKLYVGVGDAESYEITLKDPFLEYEN